MGSGKNRRYGTATNDEYDWFNRLVKRGAGITITHDAEGNRVSKTVNGTTTHYLVDDLNPTGLVSRPPRSVAISGAVMVDIPWEAGWSGFQPRALQMVLFTSSLQPSE